MSSTLADRDLRLAVEVIDVARRSDPVPGRLAGDVLSALARLVPCEDVTFADLDVAARTHHVLDAWAGDQLTTSAAPQTVPDDPFWTHYAHTRPCNYPTTTGDQRTITRTSDFLTQLQWHRSPMYVECFRGDHVNWEMMCCLPSAPGRSRRVMFFRCGTVDFSERDRMLLALLRPHLAESYARAAEPLHAELTGRQRQLMDLVAQGKTNAEIAVELVLSPYTVRKHMENIFARLGVTTRAAAVARLNMTTQ